LFARNLCVDAGECDLDHLVALCHELHGLGAQAGSPLLLSVDQEGGTVQRIKSPATVWPPMLSLEKLGDKRAIEVATAVGRAIGKELYALGFDIDFAPVLDVHTNEQNPIIGRRAFSTAPERVAERAVAFAKGMQEAGVLPCGKHFPGHGDTDTDSHLALPRLSHERERLDEIELVPFRAAISAGVPLIMTAHIVFAAIEDKLPATLSRKVLMELLRGELGYRGLIVSDDLDMKAIALHYGAGDAAVRAIEAGCDVLLLCKDPDSQDAAYEAMVRAAEGNPSFRQRVGESAAAISKLKKNHFRGREAALKALRPREHVGTAVARALADELARANT
jgi:beta-N-acetylhexosaminidase